MAQRRGTKAKRLERDSQRWATAFRRAKTEAAQLDLQRRRESYMARVVLPKMLAERGSCLRECFAVMAQRVADRCDPSVRAELIAAIQRETRDIVARYLRPLELAEGETRDSRAGRPQARPKQQGAGGAA